ncbi:hypothetical protein Tco_0270645 [Tanacetum coccineum]
MDLCTKLSDRVLALENTNTSQAAKIDTLNARIKKLEKKKRSRTYKHKRLYKGRKIADIDQDAEVTLIDETQGRNDEDLMFDTGVLNGDEVFEEPMVNAATTTSSILVSAADPVTTAGEVVTTVSVEIPDELTLAQTLIEIKSAKPKAVTTAATTVTPANTRPRAKGIVFDDQEEQAPASTPIVSSSQPSQLKNKKIQEANIAWDDIHATIEADYQLAQTLHDEEQEQYTDEEKAKFFCEFLEQRRKFFAAKRAKAKRNKPPTQAQQRKLYCNYLKNMEGYTLKQFKGFNSKRAGTKLEQEAAKKEKIDDDQEEAEMKKLMEIVLDEEEIAVDAIPLATKPPIIMLQNIDREDLETLWKLVKDKHGNTRPEKGYERVLWGDLKVMFEPNIESEVWRNLQGHKVTVWKLFILVECILVHVFDFGGLPDLMAEGLSVRMLMEHRVIREFGQAILDLDTPRALQFQLGGTKSAKQILDKGDLRDYWIGISSAGDFLGTTPSYTMIRDPILRDGRWLSQRPLFIG